MGSVQVVSHRIEVENGIDEAIKRALVQIGMVAEGYAKQYEYRVDTGLLRNSITYAVSGKPTAIKSYHADKENANQSVNIGFYSGSAPGGDENAVYIGTNVEYAPYIEFGAQGHSAVNFLRQAGENHLEEYRELIKKELKKG